MKSSARPFAFIGTLLCCLEMSTSHAEVRLPALFSDRMVLQQDAAAPVWGWAAAGEQVTVSIDGQTKTKMAGADGRWQVKLDPLHGSKPLELTVKETNTISVKDVLAGETWLCAGQSNMVMTVSAAKDYKKERTVHHEALRFRFINRPVEVGGVTITPGEVIHADQNGVIRIPPDCIGDLAGYAIKNRAFEHEAHMFLRRTDKSPVEKRAHVQALVQKYGFNDCVSGTVPSKS